MSDNGMLPALQAALAKKNAVSVPPGETPAVAETVKDAPVLVEEVTPKPEPKKRVAKKSAPTRAPTKKATAPATKKAAAPKAPAEGVAADEVAEPAKENEGSMTVVNYDNSQIITLLMQVLDELKQLNSTSDEENEAVTLLRKISASLDGVSAKTEKLEKVSDSESSQPPSSPKPSPKPPRAKFPSPPPADVLPPLPESDPVLVPPPPSPPADVLPQAVDLEKEREEVRYFTLRALEKGYKDPLKIEEYVNMKSSAHAVLSKDTIRRIIIDCVKWAKEGEQYV